MKRATIIFCIALIAGCGNKKQEANSCESVAKRLVDLELGKHASFLTDKERASRAERWNAKCEPMSEATRKCVLAATTMDQADACGGDSSAAPAKADASAKAAWVVRGGDAANQDAKLVALAADGDVIVAGDFDGMLELAGQSVTAQRTDAWVARLSPTGTVRWVKGIGGTGRDYASGLTVGADGKVVIALNASDPSSFSRVTLAPDGSVTPTQIATESNVHAAALHANGDVVAGSRAIEPVKAGNCAAMSFVVQRFTADGKRLWSRCNDGKKEVTFTAEPMKLATGPEGMTAVCAGFSGSLAWGGKAAPEGDPDSDRAFVMALDAKGEPRWVNYVVSERRGICDALAVTDDGSVVASVRGTAPGSALALWETDGAQRWTRSCSELLGEKGECYLWQVAARGSDVVVAAELDGHTVIATIDGKTGVKQRAMEFDGVTRINSLAARGNEIVFATGFSGTANFGTGPLESTAGSDGASIDVLVGRL